MKKFKCDFVADVWIRDLEIEAEDEEDLKSKLSTMSVKDMIDNVADHNVLDLDYEMIADDNSVEYWAAEQYLLDVVNNLKDIDDKDEVENYMYSLLDDLYNDNDFVYEKDLTEAEDKIYDYVNNFY